MNIVIGSAFRNSGKGLPSYFERVLGLCDHAGAEHNIRVIAVEGDSSDDTLDKLKLFAKVTTAFDIDVITHNHGGPWYGSVESKERMTALSGVGNTILSNVKDSDDVLVYIESDLIWDPHTIGSLIDIAWDNYHGADIVSPLIMAGDLFYDIYCFRKGGDRFSPLPPFHKETLTGQPFEVDSVGSCLVMRSEVARQCRIRNDEALIGFCEDARDKGYRIMVDPRFKVYHP